MITLYGIRTCDTCRRARRALEAAGQQVTFVDLRETPPARETVADWLDRLGPQLMNTRSTTWRSLTEAERTGPPVDLMLVHPTLIKRPVLEREGTLHLGWGKDVQAALLPG